MTTLTQWRRAIQAGAALVLLVTAASSWAQISPGPLSKAHKQLNGVAHCVDCHHPTKTEFACLHCHKEIAARVAAKRGLHASLSDGPNPSRECRRCHVEHKGEDTPLIRWKPSPGNFDHSKTGWALEGKHATLACNRCHNPEHVREPEIREIEIKEARRSFLGLHRQCLACHADQHRGQLGQDCLRCHSYSEWKRPPGFDHEKARFQRSGAHAQVPCQKCHQPGANGTVQYAGLSFSRCDDCHRDPHHGAFHDACQSCHNTAGWKHTRVAEKFDHARARFPLPGKHGQVECIRCHKAGDFKRPIAFGKCTDCHNPDPHSGQFARRTDRGECNACHTVEGYKPVKFGVREHGSTGFPLEGKHAGVECAKCHVPAGRATVFRLKFAACTDCHKDRHQGQFAGAPHFNHCDDCHTPRDFRQPTFTAARHETSGFALSGEHATVACAKCHKPSPSQSVPVRFRFQDRSCTACHEDPHKGKFRLRMSELRSDGSLAGCQLCHSPQAWKQVRYSHRVEDFPLIGKHRTVACAKCHQPPGPAVPLKDVDFHLAPTRCERCHQEIHGGQFASADGSTACAGCHSSAGWKPPLFDHGQRTGFPLPGKHRLLKCDACHKNVKLVQGKQVLFFKPTPRQCAGCHRNPV